MSNEVSILENLITKEKKPKSWGIIIVLSIIYLCLLLWVYFTDFIKNNPDTFEIQILSLFFLFPAFALILYIVRRKAGWVMNVVYYSFIATVMGFSFFKYSFRDGHININSIYWNGLFTLIFTLALVTLLCTNPVRKFFKVGIPLLLISTFITIGLTLSLLFIYVAE